MAVASTAAETEEIRASLADEFRDHAAEAHRRVVAILDPGRPTPAFLDALATELAQAAADPSSVPYPDLVDPDRYWAVSVQPQITAVEEHIERVLGWLESQVIETMGVAEVELQRVVRVAVKQQGPNPIADREALENQLHDRCGELHAQMDELFGVIPERDASEEAWNPFAATLRSQAQIDVDALKPAYLAEAGGDDAHQAFAEQEWIETYPERVAHREALLAATPPWRHQMLALTGYDRSLTSATQAVEALVDRVQSPLQGLPRLLLEGYDAAVGG